MNELLKANPGFQVLHFISDGTPTARQDVIAWKCEDSGVYPVTIAAVFRNDYVLQPCGSIYHPASGWFDNERDAYKHWFERAAKVRPLRSSARRQGE